MLLSPSRGVFVGNEQYEGHPLVCPALGDPRADVESEVDRLTGVIRSKVTVKGTQGKLATAPEARVAIWLLNLTKAYLLDRGISVPLLHLPMCGWGIHILVGLRLGYDVIARDVNPELLEALKGFSSSSGDRRLDVAFGPSEDTLIPETSDVVYLCPPYFDWELYQGTQQSTTLYPTRTSWKQDFVVPSVRNMVASLRKGGYLMFSADPVGEWYSTAFRDAILSCGMMLMHVVRWTGRKGGPRTCFIYFKSSPWRVQRLVKGSAYIDDTGMRGGTKSLVPLMSLFPPGSRLHYRGTLVGSASVNMLGGPGCEFNTYEATYSNPINSAFKRGWLTRLVSAAPARSYKIPCGFCFPSFLKSLIKNIGPIEGVVTCVVGSGVVAGALIQSGSVVNGVQVSAKEPSFWNGETFISSSLAQRCLPLTLYTVECAYSFPGDFNEHPGLPINEYMDLKAYAIYKTISSEKRGTFLSISV